MYHTNRSVCRCLGELRIPRCFVPKFYLIQLHHLTLVNFKSYVCDNNTNYLAVNTIARNEEIVSSYEITHFTNYTRKQRTGQTWTYREEYIKS